MLKLVATTLLLLASAPLTIRVYPQTLMVGQNVGMTCRVTPDPENRKLIMGFKMWQASERDLDGASAPITWNMIFNKVPCEPGEAFCAVQRTDGKTFRVTTEIVVAGCNNGG